MFTSCYTRFDDISDIFPVNTHVWEYLGSFYWKCQKCNSGIENTPEGVGVSAGGAGPCKGNRNIAGHFWERGSCLFCQISETNSGDSGVVHLMGRKAAIAATRKKFQHGA